MVPLTLLMQSWTNWRINKLPLDNSDLLILCPSCKGKGYVNLNKTNQDGSAYLEEKDCLVCKGKKVMVQETTKTELTRADVIGGLKNW